MVIAYFAMLPFTIACFCNRTLGRLVPLTFTTQLAKTNQSTISCTDHSVPSHVQDKAYKYVLVRKVDGAVSSFSEGFLLSEYYK